MRLARVNEPRDPRLRAISKVLPDRWIDENWPQRTGRGQGRWQQWRTSQYVRFHLLALIKMLGSFNRLCEELAHNADFRVFCRLRKGDATPQPAGLSKFRAWFGSEAWRSLHLETIRIVAALDPPPQPGVVLLDSTDLPAAVRRTSKKKTVPRSRTGWSRPVPRAEPGRARAANRATSWAIASTPCMG